MHFTIEYYNLLKIKKLLLLTTNAINLNSKTENLLISVDKNTLNFYVNNGFTSCKLIIDDETNKIYKENKLFVNTKIFLSLIDNLKDHQTIEFICQEKNILQINSGQFSCDLICTEEVSYTKETFEIDSTFQKVVFEYKDLKTINNRFKDFAKQINININKNTLLTNINIKKNESINKFFVTTTDSYRIIFGEFDIDSEPFNINLPPITLNNFINLFSDFENEKIDFFHNGSTFIVKNEQLLFKSNLFMGNYPNLNDWFNMTPNFSFEISKNKLMSALERTMLFCSLNVKKTNCNVNGKTLILEYKDSDKGSSKEEIEINNLNQQSIDFSINSFLLKQLIKNINTDKLVFHLIESLKPIMIFGKDGDFNFKQIILPLKGN